MISIREGLMLIWFATGNIHKKKELADILDAASKNRSHIAWELKIPSDAGLSFNPDETGNTFFENALIKAGELYRLLKAPVIADDSGLCVDALDGRPGILSARYGEAGSRLSDTEKNTLLLSELGNSKVRSARFVCAMVLYFGPNHFYLAQESMEGEIVPDMEAARGTGGFGYDPILYVPQMGRTVAELSSEEKNMLSHRGKAGKAIAKFLFDNAINK